MSGDTKITHEYSSLINVFVCFFFNTSSHRRLCRKHYYSKKLLLFQETVHTQRLNSQHYTYIWYVLNLTTYWGWKKKWDDCKTGHSFNVTFRQIPWCFFFCFLGCVCVFFSSRDSRGLLSYIKIFHCFHSTCAHLSTRAVKIRQLTFTDPPPPPPSYFSTTGQSHKAYCAWSL